MSEHAKVTREMYERMGIVEKLAFWETMPRGTFLDDSWDDRNNWDVFISEVCHEARCRVLELLIEPLAKEIEDGFPDRIGRGTSTWLAVTGEPYVEILSFVPFDAARDTNDGLGPGSAKLRVPHDTSQEAIDAALKNFRQYELWWRDRNPPSYAPRYVPRLYWRIKPEIDTFEGKWKVYMRCLLSAKLPLDDQSLSLLLSKRSSSSTSVSSH